MNATPFHDPAPAQRLLCDEFTVWCLSQGFPLLPGDDPMLLNLLTSPQRRWFIDFVDRWDAATDPRPTAGPLRLLAAQPAPARDVVPGKVRCAKCAFSLQRVNLYLGNGAIGAGGEEVEPCPNDGTPLLPVTWEQEARESWAMAERCFDEAKAAAADVARLNWLDTLSNEALLEFGFEMDGGVYLRIDAPGHGGTDIREKNNARAAIDSGMIIAPSGAPHG